MTYATKAELVTRYGLEELIELTDRARTGVEDDAAISKALADADAFVDGYVAGRYALPLAATPPVLATHAAAAARYYLHGDGAPEHVRTAFEDARRYLEAVAAGRVSLGLTPEPSTTAGTVQMVPGARKDWSGGAY